MPKGEYEIFEALNPFFEVVMEGLRGLVDGDHYFDTIAEDAFFEFRYQFPGWPAPGAAIRAAELTHCNESVSFTRPAVALARRAKITRPRRRGRRWFVRELLGR